jgi:dTDP-4-amino-4,6-dideoxygalactose transaminase
VSSDADKDVQVEWKVPLADVLVDDEILEAVRDTVASGWWSMGPVVQAFESEFASFCGCRHAVALANGTAALHLALLASGCGPGDEVILPSLNFVAAANAITHTGARPVFCDIAGPVDLNLDPRDVEAAVGPDTRAILVLHYGGYPCNVAQILDIARERGIDVIEDAAHAIGASWQGKMCGTFGLAGCFSFFSNKNLPIGEGGMVVTDDDDLATRLRLLRSHGMTTLTWARHRGHAHSYDVVVSGFNYRLDEVRAAIGRVQLRRLREGNAARARIVARYRRELEGVNGLLLPFPVDDTQRTSAHHLAVIVLPDGNLRDPVRASLRSAGIQTSVHYPPIHSFSEYSSATERALPKTDLVSDRLMTLPLYAHMQDGQVAHVIESLLTAVEQAIAV